eukprot:CAMPEP_0175940502 /NCGR_PEP_ID=MMETSP0108-20121206/23851_1 /TAXON_ID=195067 ORGANISM="Goniomonas pacifica, Strain CCMP1869" /NCGR_SAMPLE_ID=MMETSP0108 /ASSEMBLY_ACC=CAM_ASM_000204 /LENGTH=37 /DNA_ID= /DNA_START= /DNA_END= /DNA_ORIENTATION=
MSPFTLVHSFRVCKILCTAQTVAAVGTLAAARLSRSA